MSEQPMRRSYMNMKTQRTKHCELLFRAMPGPDPHRKLIRGTWRLSCRCKDLPFGST